MPGKYPLYPFCCCFHAPQHTGISLAKVCPTDVAIESNLCFNAFMDAKTHTPHTPQEVVEFFGNQNAAAEALGCSREYVRQWTHKGRVPEKFLYRLLTSYPNFPHKD